MNDTQEMQARLDYYRQVPAGQGINISYQVLNDAMAPAATTSGALASAAMSAEYPTTPAEATPVSERVISQEELERVAEEVFGDNAQQDWNGYHTVVDIAEAEAEIREVAEEAEAVEEAEAEVVVEEDSAVPPQVELSQSLRNGLENAFRNYRGSEYAGNTVSEEPMTIEDNIGSSSVSQVTSRFSSAVWYEAIGRKKVTLAGLGGIGSYVAFLLARMNISDLYIYDDDIVEEGNMSGQLYGRSHIGTRKAEATRNILRDFSSYYRTQVFTNRFTEESEASDIMIAGFDNMEARRTFFIAWRSRVVTLNVEDRKKCLFIDGRLAAEEFQIFCIKGDDDFHMDKYEREWLFSDSEADATVCSYKQTSFMANMIASYMVNIFTNFVTRECDSPIPRCVPFFTAYEADTMIQTIEMV